MNDTYKQLRKKVPELGAYCVDDDGFTAWVRAIQKASILQLRPQDPWTDNEALIQVRTMQEEDLECKVDLPESEHEYEDTLDVIKLPLPIPTEVLAPHFLFIRPDEYALFKCFGKHNKCILTGNPGISKSWFQWKFILLCFRQDLLDILSPFEEEQVDKLHEDQLSLKGPTTEDPSSTEQAPEEDLIVDEESLKGIETDKQTSTDQVQVDDFNEYESSSKKPKIEEQTSTEDDKCKDQAALKQNHQLFIPNLIVRTVEGNKSYFFFMDEISNVLRVEHSPQQLDYFTDENSTILWEPGPGKAPVYFTDIKARIIATVSPNMKLFHQFHKIAEVFYMPCPSELQLRLIGQIYRKFATELDNCPGDDEIHKRVVELGPFIQMIMCWSSEKRFIFKKAQNKEISRIVKSKACLHDTLESPEKIMQAKEVSHCLVRCVVRRDNAQFFQGYTRCHYQFTCKEVLDVFSKKIAKLGIKSKIKHLIAVSEGDFRG